jgi:16S rRNA (cytosine967-C5)-methyltransferase
MVDAREAVVAAVARQARQYESMPPVGAVVEGMDARDVRLAMAIHRTVIERWITLEYLLETRLRGEVADLEPTLQAILLCGGAELVFMNSAAHAVVDESVKMAKRMLRTGAGGLVNAVLRRMAEMVVERREEGGWKPGRDVLPMGEGLIRLGGAMLPPVDQWSVHLAVATSHPQELVEAWATRYGREQTVAMLLHSLKEAPTIVRASAEVVAGLGPAMAVEHERAGYAVWRGDAAGLVAYLGGGADRWAQDPTSGSVIEKTRDIEAKLIVDYCAGRGTKTRQLAMAHPEAQIVATDPDAGRFAELSAVFEGHERVKVVAFEEMGQFAGQADVLLLDVPCSNSGVLARRKEARYRYRTDLLASLSKLQRQIVRDAAGLLKREGDRVVGTVIYSTCSIEPAENEVQAAWAAKMLGMKVERSELTLPGGAETTYHDGGFFAVIGPER